MLEDVVYGFLRFVVFIIGLIFFGLWYSSYSCHKLAEIYDTTCEYNWATGCFLKHEGKFIPQEEYEKLLTPNYQMGNAEVKVKIQD